MEILKSQIILTYYKSIDSKIASLEKIIQVIKNSITELNKNFDEFEWYDGDWLLEDSEPLLGLAFLAIQNYINSSIYDRFESLDKQYIKYKLGNEIKDTGRTDIELIISIANFYKHKDHPAGLSGETPKILADFNLQFDKDVEISNSPIFEGLEILTENYDLDVLLNAVISWRENLWAGEE